MTKKMNVLELPIYKEHFNVFIEILNLLETYLNKEKIRHEILIRKTYEIATEIFPTLNAGYNYWGAKEKLLLYNKVRILLSELQSRIHLLYELKVIEKDYFEELENSLRYIGGLIRKIESNPQDK